jgi:hypothetical protein
LLVGGIEFTDALATLDVAAVELQAAIKASTPSAPAPTKRAERRKKLLRLRVEDPKFSSVPMKDLLKIEPPVNEQIFGGTFTLFFGRGKHRPAALSRPSRDFLLEFVRSTRVIVHLN